MKLHPLPEQTAAVTGASHMGEITYADLTATGNTQTLSLMNVGNHDAVQLMYVQLVENFVSSDGTLISTAITVGDGNSATRFLASTELNAAGTTIDAKGGVTASMPFVYGVDDTVDVFVTGTAAKALNTHTAGKVQLFFKLIHTKSDIA